MYYEIARGFGKIFGNIFIHFILTYTKDVVLTLYAKPKKKPPETVKYFYFF